MAFHTAELVAPSVTTGDATSNHLFDVARILVQDAVRTQIICNYPPGPTPGDLRPLIHQSDYAGYRPQSDLFVLEYPAWCPLAERITESPGARIFSYHGVTPPQLWSSEQGREQMQLSQIRTQLAWFAHLALTVSPFMQQELHGHSGYPLERIRVLPLQVPLEDLQQRPAEHVLAQLRSRWRLEGKRVLLFVGRVAGNKRIDLAVEALARLRGDYPTLHLLVVGSRDGNPAERELSAALEAQARQLGVAASVTLTGRVDEVTPYFHLADMVLLPSLHEGFGVPLVEGMAAGVPVIASASAAMPWLLNATGNEAQAAGLLNRPGDAEDLARQIRRLLKDDDLRRALVERGAARAQDFSPAAFARSLHAILAEVAELAKSPPPAAQNPVGKLYAQADIAMRNYRVSSGAPVVGRLIEWVRINSTTHVKEAYLDPIIEQQVNFNRVVADELSNLRAELRQLHNQLDTVTAPQPTSSRPLRTGVDLIEIERIRAAIERYGDHLLRRLYSEAEMAVCGGRLESLAARFAGKEAGAKALGTGIWRHGIGWRDIEITRDTASGAPLLHLHGAAQERASELGLRQWSISLSHDREHAIALAVGLGE
ncbi:MAG TPA: holo-ACP synthase [Caldilineaceae bacterium]|mgnify:CR=1 FL=1|nr:holo-ACP synthase [Caldilineaceae bacterium]